MSIIANKFKGVRASLCTSTYMGKMTRAHNDSNLLCLGGRITGYLEALDILETWLTTPYDGGRHDISLGLIAEAEETLSKPGGSDPDEQAHMTHRKTDTDPTRRSRCSEQIAQ